MGGFTENPPPESMDLPPENAFDVQAFTRDIVSELQAKGVIPKDAADLISIAANPWVALMTWLAKESFPLLLIAEKKGFELVLPQLKLLIEVVGTILKPGMNALGELTGLYVQQFVDEQREIHPAAAGGKPSGMRPAAAGLFDSILAPLGFLVGGAHPSKSGAGETNAQYVLGSIVGIHLSSWMVNIISNLTGLGALKWINSFDDVITAALSSRSLSRMAMKPYTTKFIGDPLERDLNLKLPLDSGSTSNLIRRYIRGAITQEELKRSLRGKGFDDDVVADMLLETAKLLSIDAVVWLFNNKLWTEGQAIEHLRHQGFPAEVAPVVFQLERNKMVDSEMRSLASSLVNAFVDRRLDNPTLRHLLDQAGFTPEEIDAMVTRGATLQELSRRLTLTQVRSLFQEDLVDLDYVLSFLNDEGYSQQDADLLALLEFTRKEDREQRRADLLERRRISLEAQLGFEAEADRARLDELEALGGPTT